MEKEVTTEETTKVNKESSERYSFIVEELRYQGQILWQVFGTFLLVHTVFLAFLLQSAFGSIQSNKPSLGIILTGIVGFVLCFLWVASMERSYGYFLFHMAKAREAEPSGWKLFVDDGEKFARGNKVIIGKEPYRIPLFGRRLKTGSSVHLIIGIFAVVYLFIIFIQFLRSFEFL
jgi:hypothetical protein